MGELCDRFKWAPDFWRRMGWREFRAWLRVLNRLQENDARARTTSPDSWDGVKNDGWWDEQRRKRDQMRGR